MSGQPLMKCGHTAQAIDGNGDPACVICLYIDDGAKIIDESPPDLSQRRARCTYYGTTPRGRNHESNHGCKRGEPCLCEELSDTGGRLAFFEHRPNDEYDRFFCGCWGWD